MNSFMAKSVVHYMSFLRGWIVKEWQRLTSSYYKSHQPAGASYTSDQCMETIIKKLWKISIHIWKEWNNIKLHGTDNAISLESNCIKRQQQKQNYGSSITNRQHCIASLK
jgi:hypothetical protein